MTAICNNSEIFYLVMAVCLIVIMAVYIVMMIWQIFRNRKETAYLKESLQQSMQAYEDMRELADQSRDNYLQARRNTEERAAIHNQRIAEYDRTIKELREA